MLITKQMLMYHPPNKPYACLVCHQINNDCYFYMHYRLETVGQNFLTLIQGAAFSHLKGLFHFEDIMTAYISGNSTLVSILNKKYHVIVHIHGAF